MPRAPHPAPRLLALVLVAIFASAGCASAPSPGPRTPVTIAPDPLFSGHVGHVFIIVLENKDYEATFGSEPASAYLGKTLPQLGRMLPEYYAIGHSSLDNYIAMISGQAPNPQTQSDCLVYSEFREVTTLNGQAVGQGCVYPTDVKDLGTQLTQAGRSWKMYAEDMAASAPRAPATCRHPDLNARDPWTGASGPSDKYATKHVPFLYFHDVIDDKAECAKRVVDLHVLGDDINHTSVPDLSFISPNLCSDGHDSPCVDGTPGGYAGIDAFLRAWVPRIMNSTEYRTDGLLIITFDESEGNDAAACCNEQPGYNTAQPGNPGAGGGRVGAVLLSSCYAAGSKDDTPVNHYGLLRTLEDLYHVPRLGYASQEGLVDINLGTCASGSAR